jgi:hypothetical protein
MAVEYSIVDLRSLLKLLLTAGTFDHRSASAQHFLIGASCYLLAHLAALLT